MSEALQNAKAVVRAFYNALDRAQGLDVVQAMREHVAPDDLWRGYHPFHEQTGPEAVAELFWLPLKTALTRLQRRMDVFMAGHNAIDGTKSLWVVSMGHLMGLFDTPWLGIPPTGKMVVLRYCAFHRIEGGRITEEAMFFDIPHLMMQTGLCPFPHQTAAHMVQPGPMPHDGLMFDPQPSQEGVKALAAIDFMVEDISTWRGGRSEPLEQELRAAGMTTRSGEGRPGSGRVIRSSAMRNSIRGHFAPGSQRGHSTAMSPRSPRAITAASSAGRT